MTFFYHLGREIVEKKAMHPPFLGREIVEKRLCTPPFLGREIVDFQKVPAHHSRTSGKHPNHSPPWGGGGGGGGGVRFFSKIVILHFGTLKTRPTHFWPPSLLGTTGSTVTFLPPPKK